MINVPAVDTLLDRLSTEGRTASRYELCVVVAKRARQLIERGGTVATGTTSGRPKEITLACEEIAEGKIISVED